MFYFRLRWAHQHIVLTNPSISPSLLVTVLQERYIWAEDAGRSGGRVDMYPVGSEARPMALQLHSVHELHREVAHMKRTHTV